MSIIETPSGGWLPGGVHSAVLSYDNTQYSTTQPDVQVDGLDKILAPADTG